MKKKFLGVIISTALVVTSLTGCSQSADTQPESATETVQQPEAATETVQQPEEIPAAESTEADVQDTDESSNSEPAASAPDGEIVDGALATQENPVPFGTWASVTVSDGGWPKPAYVRISNVIVDQAQVQVLLDEYNDKNPNNEIEALKEHAEFLDYVVVEYEVYFPSNFTDSDHITSRLVFSRANNEEDWIASDGSNYYWMGSVTFIDVPSRETGYPQNGDTATFKIAYPMIKNNTNYCLYYKERTEDLSETIETYFAVK